MQERKQPEPNRPAKPAEREDKPKGNPSERSRSDNPSERERHAERR